MFCAQKLARPVKWVETRSENMIAMPHGRGQVQYIEMGFTNEGNIVGMRCRIIGDAGAYGGFGGTLVLGPTRSMAQGVYRIPKISFQAVVVLTNTTPMGAFRGAGRPEATVLLERIMDMAADRLGIDPVVLRKNNFIEPGQFPYTTNMGTEYDTGEYAMASQKRTALGLRPAAEPNNRSCRQRNDPKLLGIGKRRRRGNRWWRRGEFGRSRST